MWRWGPCCPWRGGGTPSEELKLLQPHKVAGGGASFRDLERAPGRSRAVRYFYRCLSEPVASSAERSWLSSLCWLTESQLRGHRLRLCGQRGRQRGGRTATCALSSTVDPAPPTGAGMSAAGSSGNRPGLARTASVPNRCTKIGPAEIARPGQLAHSFRSGPAAGDTAPRTVSA